MSLVAVQVMVDVKVKQAELLAENEKLRKEVEVREGVEQAIILLCHHLTTVIVMA